MRKNATPKTAEAPVQRTMLRSRTTMSYAFEAAVRGVIAEGAEAGPSRRALGLGVASALDVSGTRKRPSWTVSKRPEKTARKRR